MIVAAKLRTIHTALVLYEYENSGHVFKSRSELIATTLAVHSLVPDIIDDASYGCVDGVAQVWFYIPQSASSATQEPVLYTNPDCWPSGKGVVCYNDGRAEIFSAEKYAELFASLSGTRSAQDNNRRNDDE